MKYFKEGQTVWDIRFGYGRVHNIIGGDVFVKFGDTLKRYTTDGRWASTENVSLLQVEPNIQRNVPIVSFKKGELVWVRDSGEWFVRYFSHFKDDRNYCFSNQKTEGNTTCWKEICKLTDNPLLLEKEKKVELKF